jgi:hypothetical protein
MPNTQVTVTLPTKVIRAIDREEPDRSCFVLTAVTHELGQCRNEQLQQSLLQPLPESLEVAEVGFAPWADRLPDDASDLIAPGAGEAVQWTADRGWIGADE